MLNIYLKKRFPIAVTYFQLEMQLKFDTLSLHRNTYTISITDAGNVVIQGVTSLNEDIQHLSFSAAKICGLTLPFFSIKNTVQVLSHFEALTAAATLAGSTFFRAPDSTHFREVPGHSQVKAATFPSIIPTSFLHVLNINL